MIYPANGDWFVVDCSYTYDPGSRMLNVNGTFQATQPISTAPESGSTATLLLLVLGSIFVARNSLNSMHQTRNHGVDDEQQKQNTDSEK